MTSNSNSEKVVCPSIVVPPDYTNYNADRRRMSTGNEVMRQFQKDLAEVPSLLVKRTPIPGTGSGRIHCPSCQVEVKTKTKSRCLFGLLPSCSGQVMEFQQDCPNCGASLGCNND